jgi:hypothetical protein
VLNSTAQKMMGTDEYNEEKFIILSILTLVTATKGGVDGASVRLNVMAKLNKDRDRTTRSGKTASVKPGTKCSITPWIFRVPVPVKA